MVGFPTQGAIIWPTRVCQKVGVMSEATSVSSHQTRAVEQIPPPMRDMTHCFDDLDGQHVQAADGLPLYQLQERAPWASRSQVARILPRLTPNPLLQHLLGFS